MKKYLLDTHILLWATQRSRRLDKSILEDIEYFQHSYYICVESLKEINHKYKLGKLEIKGGFSQLIKDITDWDIEVVLFGYSDLRVLDRLPMLGDNQDPTDRAIIATAIAHDFTLISADRKFPAYRKHKLKLLEA